MIKIIEQKQTFNHSVMSERIQYGRGEEVVIKDGVHIRLNNERMLRKVSQKLIYEYKNIPIKSIFIGYKKIYLGSILGDVSENFSAPRTLELDLFYGHENLENNESQVRDIFSQWEGSGCRVIFRYNHLVLREFVL
jgi:hypothetical protein